MSFKQKLKYWSSLVGCAFGTALLIGSLVFGTVGPQPSYHQGFARSAGESAYPGLWKGLVGAWVPALGVSGGILRDVSGYGNHGNLTNGPTWVVGTRGGYALNMVRTSTHHVDIPTGESRFDFDLNDDFSISGWYRHTSADEQQRMSFITKSVNPGWYLSTDSDPGTVWEFDRGNTFSSNDMIVTFTRPQDTLWHHVAVASEGGANNAAGTQGYIDGVAQTMSVTRDLLTGAILNDLNLQIGVRTDTTHPFNGDIGEVKVHNRILTPNEIMIDYI